MTSEPISQSPWHDRFMKKISIAIVMSSLAIAMLSASVIIAMRNSENSEAPPMLILAPQVITVESKDGRSPKQPAEIRVSNHGSKPVKILAVDPTCSCATAVDFVPRTIAHGESITIKLMISTPRFGIKESIVRIRTDCDDIPTKQVSIRAHGPVQDKPFVIAGSRSFSVTGAEAGQTVARDFEIRTVELVDQKIAWIVRAYSSHPSTVINVLSRELDKKLDENRVQYVYRLNLKTQLPDRTESERNERISIETSSEGMSPTGEWMVRVSAAPMVLAYPRVVRVRFDSESTGIKPVVVILKSATQFKISDIKSDAPWFRAELKDQDATDMQSVTLHFDDVLMRGHPESLHGQVVVKISQPSEYEVKIPIVVGPMRRTAP